MVDTTVPPRDWREGRRKRAFELKHPGWAQREIAEALGVSQASVSRWMTHLRDRGDDAWRAQPRPGRPTKLTQEQMDLIPDLLSHGAEAYGFRGEVWTCARIGDVVEREFGVSYHPAQVSRIMKALDWSPQRPIIRAAQRDEAAIERWRVEVWSDIKKGRVGGTDHRLRR
jgi:transposase